MITRSLPPADNQPVPLIDQLDLIWVEYHYGLYTTAEAVSAITDASDGGITAAVATVMLAGTCRPSVQYLNGTVTR